VECHTVGIVEPGRRLVTRGRTLRETDEACDRMCRAWPMLDLARVQRRVGDLPMQLARNCRCVSIELSRKEPDFFQLFESCRRRWADARKIKVTFGDAVRRGQIAAHGRSYSPSTR
jgi:hypothetical protein